MKIIKTMFLGIKTFFSTTQDYIEFKLGAIFLAITALPLTDILGIIIKFLAAGTGLILMITGLIKMVAEKYKKDTAKLEKEKIIEELKLIKRKNKTYDN